MHRPGGTSIGPSPQAALLPHLLAVAGVALLSGAWLALGRRVVAAEAPPWRTVRRIGWAWAAPLLLAMPVGSRDLWAYAAQAGLQHRGLDPYRHGPAAIGGPLADQVSSAWQHTGSPYGPLWLGISRLALVAGTDHPLRVVLLLRLASAAGLIAITFVLPALARTVGARPATVLWLAALNPLVLVLGLGGGHNDLVLVGLVLVALWLCVRAPNRWWALVAAAGVVAVAAEIKISALVVSAFLPAWWAWFRPPAGVVPSRPGRRREGRPLLAGSVVVGGVTLGAVAAVELGTGADLGWRHGLDQGMSGMPYLSVPVLATVVLAALHLGPAAPDWRGAPGLATGISLTLELIVLPLVWLTALRHGRRALLPALAVALLAAGALSTTTQSWYLLWPLPFAALIARRRAGLIALAVAGVGLTFALDVDGTAQVTYPTVWLAPLAAALAWWAFTRRPRPSTVAVPV